MQAMTQPMGKQYSRGFTLIEIMIVVIIVAILAAIAYPSYLDHVRRGHQTEAQGQMMELAAALEAHRAKNFSYAGASISGLTPHIESNQHYTHGLSFGDGNLSFTITSTPSSSLMSGMPTLTLDHDGNTNW